MTGKFHPLGDKSTIDNCSNTTIHSTPLYCYTCRKETDTEQDTPYMDVLPGMTESNNVNWVHLAPTIDTWGKRGTTWVTPEGIELPQIVPLNMLRSITVTSESKRVIDQHTNHIGQSRKNVDQTILETESQSEIDSESYKLTDETSLDSTHSDSNPTFDDSSSSDSDQDINKKWITHMKNKN